MRRSPCSNDLLWRNTDGGIGRFTTQAVPIYQCEDCHVIWHNSTTVDLAAYYESRQYWNSLSEDSEDAFYRNHDKETLDKLQYTGTDIFRDKTIADIGCGAGAFLDFLKGVAKNIVAIEPSQMFRDALRRMGYCTYPYTQDAVSEWEGAVDIATSFDVVEYVENPLLFLRDIHRLLRPGGTAIIGTPTDAPIKRSLL